MTGYPSVARHPDPDRRRPQRRVLLDIESKRFSRAATRVPREIVDDEVWFETDVDGIIRQTSLAEDNARQYSVDLQNIGCAAYRNVGGVYEVDREGFIFVSGGGGSAHVFDASPPHFWR